LRVRKGVWDWLFLEVVVQPPSQLLGEVQNVKKNTVEEKESRERAEGEGNEIRREGGGGSWIFLTSPSSCEIALEGSSS
jgi:hypothetical protein